MPGYFHSNLGWRPGMTQNMKEKKIRHRNTKDSKPAKLHVGFLMCCLRAVSSLSCLGPIVSISQCPQGRGPSLFLFSLFKDMRPGLSLIIPQALRPCCGPHPPRHHYNFFLCADFCQHLLVKCSTAPELEVGPENCHVFSS